VEKKLGGIWYSTPAAGQCTGARRPGDGSGCTWRVARARVTIRLSLFQYSSTTLYQVSYHVQSLFFLK
jgi:hypothetical protein